MTRRRVAAGAAALAVAGAATFLATRSTETRVLPTSFHTFTKFHADCGISHTNSDDPIVFSGTPNATHPHDYFGNRSTFHASTYSTMLAGATTCDEQGDKAGYWMPRLTLGNAYQAPKFGLVVTWYSQPDACPRFACPNPEPMPVNYTFPKDLRIIAGKATASAAADNPLIASQNVMWSCYPASGTTFTGIPNECKSILAAKGKPGGRLDLWVRFPACWDGVNIDSPNHRDHMAYPTTAGCPASHPVVLPQLVVQVQYPPFNGSTWNQASGGYSSGPFYSVHFDFWNTWIQSRLEELTAPSPPES